MLPPRLLLAAMRTAYAVAAALVSAIAVLLLAGCDSGEAVSTATTSLDLAVVDGSVLAMDSVELVIQ
jgi:hypothetical protein